MAEGTIKAPILRTIALEVLALIKSDAELRRIQGLNAPRAAYFDQQTLAAGTVPYTIVQARGAGQVFSSLVITFETVSGSGYYRLDGMTATPTTGVEIPSGGGILVITGHDNIAGFSMTPKAANSLIFSRYLYQ